MDWLKGLLMITAVPLGFYGLLVLLMYAMQAKMVYHPWSEMAGTPRSVGLRYEDVTFTAADGTRLHGWYVPAGFPEGLVIICHGNAGNISHRLETIHLFRQMHWSVFIFDYRGYGQSEGTPDEEGTYRDAEAAWEYAVSEGWATPDSIVLFGRSLGGAVAAWLAERKRPRALILESTFTSVPDLGAKLYPYLPVRLLSRFSYHTRERMANITCPVLIVHSRDDTLVPYSHGRRLYEAASPPKEFLDLTGDHNDGFLATGEAYVEGIQRFLDSTR